MNRTGRAILPLAVALLGGVLVIALFVWRSRSEAAVQVAVAVHGYDAE